MKSLGVEHHIVSLDWGEQKQQSGLLTSVKGYQGILQYCQKMDIGTLLEEYTLDDQIGKI